MQFRQMITSELAVERGLFETEQRVRNYLEHVLVGSHGTPFCPFVRLVHAGNGYWWREYVAPAKRLSLEKVVADLCAEFWQCSIGASGEQRGIDIITMVAAFSHDSCNTKSFGKHLTTTRNILRQLVLEQGLMLAHMFNAHDDPKGDGRYVSPIPLLMVRRMHKPDRVFMRTARELAAYHRFFPSNNP